MHWSSTLLNIFMFLAFSFVHLQFMSLWRDSENDLQAGLELGCQSIYSH